MEPTAAAFATHRVPTHDGFLYYRNVDRLDAGTIAARFSRVQALGRDGEWYPI